MDQQQQFIQAVMPLLQRMGVADQIGKKGDVYSFKIDDHFEIALVGSHAGFINIIASPGKLSDEHDREVLLHLLMANQFGYDHPPLLVGVEPEDGAVVLWARLGLAEANDSSVIALFDRILVAAEALYQGLTSSPSPEDNTENDPGTNNPGMRV